MNAMLPLFAAALDASDHRAANLLAAARALTPQLNRSRALDRRLVANVMTTTFGGSDADGVWLWRDAYDAIEAALVLQLRRLAPQIARLEDAPADIAALLANLAELSLTHTRRSEEQVVLDQFSTPPQLGALAVLAAQVRPGDQVLEPSAGTGLLAILAEACGAAVTLNEISAGRAALLESLFPLAPRFQHDAAHLRDVLQTSGAFHVALTNPPFQQLEAHLHAAFDCLADGGRLCAIVPARLFEEAPAMRALAARGSVRLRLTFPARAYAKHGTSVETGLLVVDRGGSSAAIPNVVTADTLADAAQVAARVAGRATAQPRQFRSVHHAALFVPRARTLAAPSNRLAFLSDTAPVAYETCAWSGEGHDVGLYQAYALGRIRFPKAAPHPSPLVESGPMASVAPPAPSYRAVLPTRIAEQALVSDAQMETVIYAGEAHAQLLPGAWILGEAPHQVILVKDDHPGAVAFRKGFFVGDGTGCGKGREISGVIADNFAQGRPRGGMAVERTTPSWRTLGATGPRSVAQMRTSPRSRPGNRPTRSVWIRASSTPPTPPCGSRSAATGPRALDQVVAWRLENDFDGVIVFDEAHAMANAGGGGKGARGAKKASQQGMAGLALQNRLPDARILYVSATGATTPGEPGLRRAARPLGRTRGPLPDPRRVHGRRRNRRGRGDGTDRARTEGPWASISPARCRSTASSTRRCVILSPKMTSRYGTPGPTPTS